MNFEKKFFAKIHMSNSQFYLGNGACQTLQLLWEVDIEKSYWNSRYIIINFRRKFFQNPHVQLTVLLGKMGSVEPCNFYKKWTSRSPIEIPNLSSWTLDGNFAKIHKSN